MSVAEYMNSPEKRALDLVVVGALGETVLRYGAVAAAALFALNRKPPIYSQKRPGIHNKEFSVFKLRTMHEDGRLLKFGAKIRSLALDELPQLYNVARGDMSVVGYRPLLPEDIDQTVKAVNDQTLTDKWLMLREGCKPGAIGPAQLMPVRSDAGSVQHSVDVITLENKLMETGTLLGDIRMIAATPATMLTGHNVTVPRAQY